MSNPSPARRTPAQNAVLETLRHHRQPMSAQVLYSARVFHLIKMRARLKQKRWMNIQRFSAI
ncbi:MAG: hypothetical protein QNJ46_14420 [Leptolyngbyaceae cyanobacterium MO_188.B28]|nr:hypothetical protein [Leptolyngbyaceae cyanobacterium MO_188.B28]